MTDKNGIQKKKEKIHKASSLIILRVVKKKEGGKLAENKLIHRLIPDCSVNTYQQKRN